MRAKRSAKGHWFGRVLMSMLVLLALFAVACGSSPAAEQQQTTTEATQPDTARPEALAIPATQAPAPQTQAQAPAQAPAQSGSQAPASQPASEAPAPTAAPQPTQAPPAMAEPGRDTLIFLTAEEPTTVGAASANCGGNIQNTICDDLASDPFTWIDDHNNYRGRRA